LIPLRALGYASARRVLPGLDPPRDPRLGLRLGLEPGTQAKRVGHGDALDDGNDGAGRADGDGVALHPLNDGLDKVEVAVGPGCAKVALALGQLKAGKQPLKRIASGGGRYRGHRGAGDVAAKLGRRRVGEDGRDVGRAALNCLEAGGCRSGAVGHGHLIEAGVAAAQLIGAAREALDLGQHRLAQPPVVAPLASA